MNARPAIAYSDGEKIDSPIIDMRKYFLTIFGILLLAYLSVTAQSVSEEAVPLATSFERPNFSPTKDWSIKYVNLFKQAIKEKYSIDDKTLNENLIVQSVVKGTQVDGTASASSREDIGSIHYIYKIQWAYFNGYGPQNGLSFVIKDGSGNDLTDKQILENIQKNLIPIFAIKSIISEKDAINKCGGQSGQLFPPLRAPFYASDNNIPFDASRKDLIFFCNRVVNAEANKCLREVFSLQTGEKFLSQEVACVVQAATTKPVVTPDRLRIDFYQISQDGKRIPFSNFKVSLYDTSNNLVRTDTVRDGTVTFIDLPSGTYIASAEFSGYFAPDQNNISCRERCDPDLMFDPPYIYDSNTGARLEREILPYEQGKLLVIFREGINRTDIDAITGKHGVTYEPLREAGTNKILLTFRHGTIKVNAGKEKEILRNILSENAVEKIYLASLRRHVVRSGATSGTNQATEEKPAPFTEGAVPVDSYPKQILNKIGDRVWNYKVVLTVTSIILLIVGSFIVGLRYTRKIVKVPLMLIGVVGTIILLNLLYNFFILGQKDFGILYQYSYCENGIYSTYPRGVIDGGTAYYNRQGEKLGWCDAWGVTGDRCEETAKSAGKCEERSMFGR